eukprot:COSAG06_NODE_1703_length_8656_cov_22.238051_8_plen_148_part_00
MAVNIEATRDDALGDDAATHTLVYHFTTLFSLDLIMGGHGLRATPSGQLNGGLSVCLVDPTQLKWEQWSGNRFRECVGRELWGTKWRDLLLKGKTADGEIVDADGKDHDKIEYLIVRFIHFLSSTCCRDLSRQARDRRTAIGRTTLT